MRLLAAALLSAGDLSPDELRRAIAIDALWITWILALRPIARWTVRHPVAPGRRARDLAFHAGRLALLSLAVFAGRWALLASGPMGLDPDWMRAARAIAPFQILSDALIYAAMVIGVRILEVRREIDDEDVAARELEAELERARWSSLRARWEPEVVDGILDRLGRLCEISPARASVELARFGDLLRRQIETLAPAEGREPDPADDGARTEGALALRQLLVTLSAPAAPAPSGGA